MINNLFIFIVALFLVIKGATVSSKYAARLARNFNLSTYAIGFIIVAIISILPEAFISINAALEGIPAFGLGTLFGSNVADLTLVFVITILVANRGLKIESKILKNRKIYPFLLLLPLILGLDGNYSRLEGLALIIAGLIFYYISLKRGGDDEMKVKKDKDKIKNFFLFLFGLTLLLAGSRFTVSSAISLANYLGVNPVLIGMLIVGLGTTIPELSFSLQSVKKKNDSLAVGDVLGTVLADATVLVGILALINPFSFPQRIIYVTGAFMVLASFILFNFMKTGRKISRKEAILLFFFWLIFVLVEFIANK